MNLIELDYNSLKKIGYRETYDLEVDDKNHNFVLENNIVTSNSHSCAYAINAYISMWLKIYYPLEYFSALINNSGQDEISWFIKNIKSANLKINDFKMNKCSEKFDVDYENKSLKYGLNIVKGINSKDIAILVNTNINTLPDLVTFIKDNKISKRTIEPLCRLNFFSEIFDNAKSLEFILIESKKIKKSYTLKDILKLAKKIKDYNNSEKIIFEKKYLNFYINEHPFTKFHEEIKLKKPDLLNIAHSPKTLGDNISAGDYILIGIVNQVTMLRSKKTQKEYYKLLLEDDEKQIYITIWNAKDIVDINPGNFIIISCSKNSFGFSKNRQTSIEKITK